MDFIRKFGLLLSIFFILGNVSAADQLVNLKSNDKVTRIILDSNKLIHYYWEIIEFRIKFESGDINLDSVEENQEAEFVKTYLKTLDSYNKLVKKMAKRLIRDFNKTSPLFLSFSGFYKSLDKSVKEALDPVIRVICENYEQTTPNSNLKEFLQAYFPGYGYGDPNFRYRKGKEVSREFLYARWLEESRTISQSKIIELVVELSIAAGIKEKYPDARIGKAFPIDLGGKIVMAVKVTWNNTTTITTRTKKKIGHYKVWFELFKAKKGWGTPQWELCGKTYELLEEATGEEVTVSMKFE
ncbi:hypothetical protein ACFL35_01080 [Candidatus Riflebacteria bacterium]